MLCMLRCQQLQTLQVIWLNTLSPGQNRYFQMDLNENVRISLIMSLKFVPLVRVNDNTILDQKTAWHWPGEKPLSEPMMASLMTKYASLGIKELNQRCNVLWMHWSYHMIELHWIALWLRPKDAFYNNRKASAYLTPNCFHFLLWDFRSQNKSANAPCLPEWFGLVNTNLLFMANVSFNITFIA